MKSLLNVRFTAHGAWRPEIAGHWGRGGDRSVCVCVCVCGWVGGWVGGECEVIYILLCNRVYCIHVPGHDPITFSFRSFSFLIGWGVYGPVI